MSLPASSSSSSSSSSGAKSSPNQSSNTAVVQTESISVKILRLLLRGIQAIGSYLTDPSRSFTFSEPDLETSSRSVSGKSSASLELSNKNKTSSSVLLQEDPVSTPPTKEKSTSKKMPPAAAVATNQPPIIFIIGGPGSGKGTICDRIKAKYGFTHLSTGDLLREEVASGSALGRALNEVMVAGRLVSNEQVLELLRAAIEKHRGGSSASLTSGFLIDGYPREIGQAIDFERTVCAASIILYFQCSDAEMTRRLLNRAKTSGRADDNEATIRKRLVTFHANTQPILQHFEPKLATVNSERNVDEVFAEVEGIIAKLLTV